jgi:uncharacterized protein YpmS
MTQTLQGKEKTEEEVFYKDLDDKKSSGGCCTCQTIAILFSVILLLAILIIIFLYYQITHGGALFNGTDQNTDISTSIENIKADNSGEFQLSISSNELSALLNDGLTTGNFILKDIHTSINPTNVLIYGTLVKPISSKVVITAVPRAENGKIVMKVTKFSAGKINLPTFLSNYFTTTTSNLLNQKLNLIYVKYSISQVTLNNDQMTIFGHSK